MLAQQGKIPRKLAKTEVPFSQPANIARPQEGHGEGTDQ